MSGKTIIAFVALAASTASATTATVVYRIFQSQPVHALAAGGGGASGQGHAAFAVMSNASENSSGSFVDSDAESGSPACLSDGDSQRCASDLQGPEVRVKILGSTPTFPPIWLGGDSEDQYTLAIHFSDPLSTRRHLSSRSAKTPLTNLGARQELQTRTRLRRKAFRPPRTAQASRSKSSRRRRIWPIISASTR